MTYRIPLLLSCLAASTALAGTTELPPSLAGAPGSASNRGFVVRSVQAPVDAVLTHNSLRAIRQLHGTLTDEAGTPIPNEATPGPEPGGVYYVDTVNFERDGLPYDIITANNEYIWTFIASTFPGIPGAGFHTDKFAVEVVAYLDLPAGPTTFAISVGSDRTDVNDDDGYEVYVGSNPRDFLATRVASYERQVPGFNNGVPGENQWTVVTSQAGVYPFRITYWQLGRGANLTWYTVNNETGERILVNDPADERSIKAYRTSSIPATAAPYIAEIAPPPGSAGNSPAAPITVTFYDGAVALNDASVALKLNGAAVTPQSAQRSGKSYVVTYNPNASRVDPNNLVEASYRGTTGDAINASWSFTIVPAGGVTVPITGQWDFDQGNLAATVGAPLAYLDGPAGLTAAGTQFGTTTSFGLPDIGGAPALVMRVPGDLDRNIGYLMPHGIAPNGGGTKVNQFTLIMDVYVADTGSFAASLLQISSQSNSDDGDLFWQQGNFGQGGGGYNGKGTFTAGAWHRVAAAYDLAANPPVVVKYVDGIKQDDWTANLSLDGDRRALQPWGAILFGDGDQDERREMFVNSIQIRAGRLSDAELALLGGPSASGIPQTLPQSNVTGQWDFEFGDLSPTVGSPLAYLDGPEGLTKAGTLFGTTGDGDFATIENIAGQPAKVMRVPGDLDRNIGYIMTHRIAPNGGGTLVNQYTLVMDVYVATTGSFAAALLQTSSVNNTDDGDLFWQQGNFGQGGEGYLGRGTFTAGAWHRVVAAYDMAANPPVVTKYVDGIKQHDWTANQGLDNPRRALQPTALLFADGDQDERREMWVSSIQVRAGKLTDAQIVALGGPSAAGIPIATPRSTVTGQWDFTFGDLGATIGKNLAYLDGDAGLTATGTKYGLTGDGDFAEIPLIGGQPARVMYVPGDLDRNIGYVMTHLIAPNGGGTLVNQYTIAMDVLVGTTGSFAAAMLQISSPSNADDGDLFWQQGNFGQGGGGYNGAGTFTAGQWHRVVAAYDMAANPPVVVKYVDGIFQDNWTANHGLDNPRRALQPTAVLFGDGDQDERREWWVSSVQIRAGALSPAEIESMGGPTAHGLPVVLSVAAPTPPPALTISRSGNSVVISWPADADGYLLESTASLGAAWSQVQGVSGNSVTVPANGTAFYRLKK